jgi:hypothetical protein
MRQVDTDVVRFCCLDTKGNNKRLRRYDGIVVEERLSKLLLSVEFFCASVQLRISKFPSNVELDGRAG